MKTEPSSVAAPNWGGPPDERARSTASSEADPAVHPQPPRHPEYATYPCPGWKRAVDFLAIVLSLPLLLPVMIGISLWVAVSSRGPILFRQDRVGFGGQRFTIYKFRSMTESANTEVHTDHVEDLIKNGRKLTKLDKLGDSRLIHGGAMLRMTGLDELPQLLNVLRGEMSLVGPRPCLPKEYEFYEPEHRGRFAVHPGLTGYWQVRGKNHTTFLEMIEMDCTYVRKRSLPLDLLIMIETPWALFKQVLETQGKQGEVRSENKPDELSG